MSKKKNKKKMSFKKKLSLFIVLILLLLTGVTIGYFEVYYHVDPSISLSDSLLVGIEEENGYIKYTPKALKNNNVLIIYPGAKVEAKAYTPLAKEIASTGATVYIVREPLRFALFNKNAANSIVKKELKDNPNAKFYLAGHSLGGATAGMYLAKNSDKFNGVIFLAAYTTKDLSNTSLKGLSIYGSEDLVLNKDQYENNKSNLPKNTLEIVIPGGNHAQFASYGVQKGDGTATISDTSQVLLTTTAIVAFMI